MSRTLAGLQPVALLSLETACFPWQLGKEQEGGSLLEKVRIWGFSVHSSVSLPCLFFIPNVSGFFFFLIVPIAKYQLTNKSVQQHVKY